MNKEKEAQYKKLNTPVVTHMLNIMQWMYSDKHVRGSYDELFVDNKAEKVAPLFSAFQSFILASAICMRKPGQEKIINATDRPQREILENIDKILMTLQGMLMQPLRTSLINGLEIYITNGKWETKPMEDKEAEILFGRKPN